MIAGKSILLTIGAVDEVRLGRLLRALRLRQGLRQSDVASLADVSQPLISMIERGHLGAVSHDRLRRIFGVLEADTKAQSRGEAARSTGCSTSVMRNSAEPSPVGSAGSTGTSSSR